MEITVGEAADALGVDPRSIVSWYTKTPGSSAPPYFGLDTEVLCAAISLDHRFLMAFLVGYDIALSTKQVQSLVKRRFEWVRLHTTPVFAIASYARLGKPSLVRYSYRRVAPFIAAQLEDKNGKHRTAPHGAGAILPAPDLMPDDSFTFRSALITEGTRLPRARSTRLADGSKSTLPVLDGHSGAT